MKKVICILAALVMCLGLTVPVLADEVEKVEKELVFKPGTQLIVIIASAVIVLASIAVIVTVLVKGTSDSAKIPEEPTDASDKE